MLANAAAKGWPNWLRSSPPSRARLAAFSRLLVHGWLTRWPERGSGLLDGAGQLLPQVGQFFLDKLPGWRALARSSLRWVSIPRPACSLGSVRTSVRAINGIAAMAPAIRRATVACVRGCCRFWCPVPG